MSTCWQYRHAGAGVIRAAAQLPGAVPGLWTWPGDEAPEEQWRTWVMQVWGSEHVAEAVRLASPSLARSLDDLRCAGRARPGQVRRLAVPLARYLTRMRGRATPFGLFAGIAPLRFGADPSGTITGTGTMLARADAVWLAAIITRLESCQELLDRLGVVANDHATVRGERLVVLWPPHGTDVVRSASGLSVRYSPPVRAALSVARSPVLAADLAGKLAAEFPGTGAGVIEEMIAGLVRCGVLITSLRPPSTSTDGLRHLLDQLAAVDAQGIDDIAPLLNELHAIAAELAAASGPPGPAVTRARDTAAHRMRAVSSSPQTSLLAVDMTLAGAITLPDTVAAEAGSAAGALARLTAYPCGHPAWQDYHARFLNRYGAGAMVLVGDLTDPVGGLGFPAHYAEPDPGSHTALSSRDERLLALAQQAAMDGTREIVLDDALVDLLAVPGTTRPVPHAELCADVRAASRQALSDGIFTLAVTGVSRSGLAMTGRFLAVLPGPERDRIAAACRVLPGVVDGAVTAQLSFPPRHARLENVTRVPVVLPVLISVAEHHGSRADRIPLEDLAVTADDDGLYVVSMSRGQVIEPVVVNAAARQALPPVVRLLAEIPRARLAALTPFAWGAASCLPFLPRLRYGKTILAAARWRIPPGALPGPGTPGPEWLVAAGQLRERLYLPAVVDVGVGDRKLRLNLDQPADLLLLRDLLVGTPGAMMVSEAPSPDDHGWLDGRAHEIVIPVATTGPAARPPAITARPAPWIALSPASGRMPGSQVLCAKLYGHPEGFDAILTRCLPDLLAEWDELPRWWYIRYRDPQPHLRLRLHLASPGGYGTAAVRVGAWADKLRGDRLITDLTLATYHPETARYGSGAAMTAAEALFAADSAAAVAQLEMLTNTPSLRSRAVTAASMADLACALAGSPEAGMRWLVSHRSARTREAREPDRDVLRQAITLSGTGPGLLAVPGGTPVASAWQARARAAVAYAGHVTDLRSAAHTDVVLGSLLHMHHARVHGPGADCEPRCRRLTRAIALAWTARTSPAGDQRS